MPQSVVERLLVRVLPSVGLSGPLNDRWEAGCSVMQRPECAEALCPIKRFRRGNVARNATMSACDLLCDACDLRSVQL